MPQATSTARIEGERSAALKPSREVAPVAARERALALQQARRDPHDEHDRDDERHRVDRVRGRRAGRRGQDAAEERADGPAQVLDRLEQRVRRAAAPRRDEVRDARRRPPGGRSRSRGRPRAPARRPSPALGANGSATKTPTRTASAAIISERRSSRSSSGPSKSPTTIVGRNSTTSTARDPEAGVRRVLVRSWTSIASATAAMQRPDARAERREEEVPEPRKPERRRAGRTTSLTSLRPKVPPMQAGYETPERTCPNATAKNSFSSGVPTRDADRLGRAEAVERADDDAFPLQPLEQLAPAADVGEEEVAARRPDRLEPVAAQDLGQPVAAGRVQLPPPRDLLRVVEARERGRLRGRRHVERAPHLARRRRRRRPAPPPSRPAGRRARRSSRTSAARRSGGRRGRARGRRRSPGRRCTRSTPGRGRRGRAPAAGRGTRAAPPGRSPSRSGCSGGRRRRASSAARSRRAGRRGRRCGRGAGRAGPRRRASRPSRT